MGDNLCTSGLFVAVVVDINEAPSFYGTYHAAVKENAAVDTSIGPRVFAKDQDQLTLEYTDPHGTSCCGSTNIMPGALWKTKLYQQKHCLRESVHRDCNKRLVNHLQVTSSYKVSAFGPNAWSSNKAFNCSLGISDQISSHVDISDVASCEAKCVETVSCKSWQFKHDESNLCILFSKTPVLVTDNTHTCGFNHVSLNARLRVDGDRRSAQVSFSFAGKDTFAVNRIVMKTPLNGVSCNSALLQGKKADESWETIKEINFDSVVDVDTTKSFPEWRFINFGGDVSGACDIDGIVIDGRVINDSDMANLGSDYSSDNSRMRCSVCHACYLKCGRYSDANRYRFKACVGTESECKRQVLNTDIDGEVTFAGDPFASAITSLKVGSYLWSGIRQYTKHNRMKRRLLRFENKKKFSLRLTGLNFNHFVESDDAKLAASSRIARSLGVSLNQLKINSVRKGSVIIDFEVIREENEEPLDFSSFVEDHKNGVLESSLKEAMASISGVDSNELKVAELSNIMEHNERNLVTAPNLEDWQCYLERYDDIIDATETGAYQHWIKYGDEEGRLWGCFDGYFDSTENLQDFVFTTDVAKRYNSISMKPNLRLFISESIAARGGFLYLKTFEKATETKRKRKIDMPLYYTIVSGNDEDIFKIDHATGQIAIKSAQKLNRGLKSKYQLSISSSDLGGLSSVTTVEITVLESNDPPTAFDATFNIPENLP